MFPGLSSVANRWPSSWKGSTALVTRTVTPVARPMGVSEYLSTTAFALSPSAPCSTATEMVPSDPRYTVPGIAVPPSFQVHDHLHEIDREGGLERHGDDGLPVDLLCARGRDVERVGDQHL